MPAIGPEERRLAAEWSSILRERMDRALQPYDDVVLDAPRLVEVERIAMRVVAETVKEALERGVQLPDLKVDFERRGDRVVCTVCST